jgi:uncharacterized protein YbcV (DUF1398 family)
MIEESTPRSRSYVAVKKKMIHGLLSFLAHIVSIITITCRFLRLSKVKILPRVADHENKAALEGARAKHFSKESDYLLNKPSSKKRI